jgi:hypothetical protein
MFAILSPCYPHVTSQNGVANHVKLDNQADPAVSRASFRGSVEGKGPLDI